MSTPVVESGFVLQRTYLAFKAFALAAIETVADDLSLHASNTSNPHGVTKAQVGLGSVDNVSAASLRDRSTHTGTQAAGTITGLGGAATLNVGTTAGTVAAGDHLHSSIVNGIASVSVLSANRPTLDDGNSRTMGLNGGGFVSTSFSVGVNPGAWPNAQLYVKSEFATYPTVILQSAPSQTSPFLMLRRPSSTGAVRDAASVDASWFVNTDALRQADLVGRAWDSNGAREVWRGRADGTSPLIGFLGATPVARTTVSAAATDGATTQALVNELRALVINLGFAQ